MKKTIKNNTLKELLSKNYPVMIYPAKEGGFVADIEELPGCITQGETIEEVYENIENARKAWIEETFNNEMEVPLPRTEIEYSGKFILRLPKYLHRKLTEAATKEGISLNQYVLSILANDSADQEKLIEHINETRQEILNAIGEILNKNVYAERAESCHWEIEKTSILSWRSFPLIKQELQTA